MLEILCISFALGFGLVVRGIGLPPLVGFLAAGFVLHAVGPGLGLPSSAGEVLREASHLGVLLLLFTVGLKLRLGQLVQLQVLGSALLQSAVGTILFALGLGLVLQLDGEVTLLLGILLSFSSTVFTAKVLDARRDLGTVYGRTAVGILVAQDILALAVLAIWGGHAPSILALPLVLALPILRPALHWLLDASGHDELLVLNGLLMALVLGGAVFAAVGLGSELGALVMGLMLSTHRQAKELSSALWGLKELFLVGFFLQIGMAGLPDMADLWLALGLILVLPLKFVLFWGLLLLFRLRSRTAFLTAASLTTYSEFGLIVAAGLLPDFVVPLALAVSLSLVAAAPLDHLAQRLHDQLEPWLGLLQATRVHRDEQPTDLGLAQVLVLGMGRTGTSAYDRLEAEGIEVVGLDADPCRVAGNHSLGRDVHCADVEDAGFWCGLRLGRVKDDPCHGQCRGQ